MKFLLVCWTALRLVFEAAVWATAIWCVSDCFFEIPWVLFYWVFLIVLFVHGFWVVRKFLEINLSLDTASGSIQQRKSSLALLLIDLSLVGWAILMSFLTSWIPAAIVIAVISVLSLWTGRQPDWLHVWLFFACVFYLSWRQQGARGAMRGLRKAVVAPGK